MCAILNFCLICLMMLTSAVLAVPQLPNEQGIARLFFNSRFSMQDPERAIRCFNTYGATSTQISDTYSRDYNNCLQRSRDTRKRVDTEVRAEQQAVWGLAKSICGRIETCNKMTTSLEMFGCHAESGSSNTKDSYTVAQNSSDGATMLQERYRAIQINEERCCGLAERFYVEKTTSNYNNLQSCLSGQAIIPPSTPPPPPPKETSTTNGATAETSTTNGAASETSTTNGATSETSTTNGAASETTPNTPIDEPAVEPNAEVPAELEVV